MSVQKYQVVRTTHAAKVAALLGAVVLLILVLAPWWAGRADLRLIGEFCLYLALASLWNLMAGYAGLVSVGQQAYVGFGGYMLFALSIFGGLHPVLAIALAGLLGGLVSVPVAALIFRLRGAYFAIGTWVVAEVFRLSFAQISALGGGSGTSLPTDIVRSLADGRDARESVAYWLSLGIAVSADVMTYTTNLLRQMSTQALTAPLQQKSFP
jgi:branched-chain amino acid transport system permease protein